MLAKHWVLLDMTINIVRNNITKLKTFISIISGTDLLIFAPFSHVTFSLRFANNPQKR